MASRTQKKKSPADPPARVRRPQLAHELLLQPGLTFPEPRQFLQLTRKCSGTTVSIRASTILQVSAMAAGEEAWSILELASGKLLEVTQTHNDVMRLMGEI